MVRKSEKVMLLVCCRVSNLHLDYFCVVDNDIRNVKFGEQFVGCNPLLLI